MTPAFTALFAIAFTALALLSGVMAVALIAATARELRGGPLDLDRLVPVALTGLSVVLTSVAVAAATALWSEVL